jgi:N-acetylmuramoyl-L-alanine amidase CwlA
MGIPVYLEQIDFNITQMNRTRYDMIGLMIHGTANLDHAADDLSHFNYFNSANRNASADWFVDHDSITRLNDWRKFRSWAIGDYKEHGLTQPLHGLYNSNTCSIELCVNYADDPVKMKATIENGAKLAVYLMKYELFLNMNQLYRHFDSTRKYCPGLGYPMVDC